VKRDSPALLNNKKQAEQEQPNIKSLEFSRSPDLGLRERIRKKQIARRRKYNLLEIIQERKVASYVTSSYKTDLYDHYLEG